MLKRGVLRLLLAVAALTAACSDDEGTGPGEGMARLRVVHADARTGEVDVVVDDIEMASDLSFLNASDYLELEAGSRQVVFLTVDGTLDDRFSWTSPRGWTTRYSPAASGFPTPCS